MKRRTIYFIPFFILMTFVSDKIFAQPTWTLDPFGKEKKPEQYEEKKLGSEKTADKKFTGFRHFVQNNITHYNFYFNANNKINTVIERAKISQKDDYSKLLPFYPYTLDNTAAQKTDLDSVIYKSTAGILLHDLRNDWVDNLYLLIGKSYFLRKEMDSAMMTFQFINYNLFPRKKNEDDSRIVGTNTAATSSVISIANKEKRNLVQKIVTQPPSRNDALIWLARTFIEKESFGEAAGLINILQNDPNLPKRLRNDLEEVNAYWFYKQKIYDSAAVHLEKGLSSAADKQDKARWEYLLGQLYEMTGSFDKASDFYASAAKHTVSPVMDIYARLNDAKMFRNTGNIKELDKSIDNLLKMARKDKFEAYRDIIYYSTGQLSLQKPDSAKGIVYFGKSLKYNESNTLFRTKAYLQLGHIAYSQARYKDALNAYDSLDMAILSGHEDSSMVSDRKNTLAKIVQQISIIEREDSLQMVASMAPAERDAFLKKLARKYAKEAGQKVDDNFTGNTLITFNDKNAEPKDLFEAPSKGEWYFYNSSLKSRGFNEFKSKWGKRDNVDNWRRKAAADAAVTRNLNANIDIDAPLTDSTQKGDFISRPLDFSYEGMMANLPMSKEALDSSKGNVAKAMVTLAKLFQNELQDYEQAINTYDIYLQRFPDSLMNGEVYLGLYYCYNKLGNTAKADYYKNLLNTRFAGSAASKIANNPAQELTGRSNPEAASKYESIYALFIEGNFEAALAEKKIADSLFGNSYWTPQLLYIESVYYVRDRKDSQAIGVLKDIIKLYPTSALKAKAATMIDVLGRRAQIEAYLDSLQVTRVPEDIVIMADDKPVQQITQPVSKAAEPKVITPIKSISVKPDSAIKMPANMVSGEYSWQADKPHFVVMILNKVDPVYVGEAKNAFSRYNREKYAQKQLQINKEVLDADKTLLVFTSFADAAEALTYYDKIKKAAPSEVSWLQAGKYSFMLITDKNLQLLKTNKNLDTYKALLHAQYPERF